MAKQKKTIVVMRVYDYLKKPTKDNAFLVDRLWPRGISKEMLKDVQWVKTLAPSSELRKSYGHDPNKFANFRQKYLSELKHADKSLISTIKDSKTEKIVLLTATKKVEISAASVLKEFLDFYTS